MMNLINVGPETYVVVAFIDFVEHSEAWIQSPPKYTQVILACS